ncbi:cysteine-rich secretory protein 2-like [Anthonomus grandis grandis]|uniref:cysteine-rich secretory protein 2-like n=1 Tax=Anthonomus grandis grandis TaxID=2921223 RepID=UPI00216530F6|nr:cysteine-rich secretory protein 2-like [Anthonomus grandis grandis]
MKVFILVVLMIVGIRDGSSNILGTGISLDEQQSIVDIHNNYRISICNGNLSGQPQGYNIKKIKYDAILAEKAQEIANTTTFAHVSVKDDRWSVGQNLYISMSTAAGGTPSWSSALSAWFVENSYYKYGACCSTAGHYTQMIWDSTEYVGCGFTYFYSNSSKYSYQKLYVCNYGPAGNWVGSYPYQSGDSGCPELQ